MTRSMSTKRGVRWPIGILGGLLEAALVGGLAVCFGLIAHGASRADQGEVTVGYQIVISPWKAAIADRVFETETGWTINWRQFDAGSAVNAAMASGQVGIGVVGSSPMAAGLSQQIPYDLAWVLEFITAAEALAVRDRSGIQAPQDLRGKRIAVPFVANTHFHLLFALQQFGIDEGAVDVLNMRPPQMISAWARDDIDAAFVWYPVLGRLLETGKVLVTAGQLAQWGRPTFDGLMVRRDFAAENPDFVAQFIKIIERYSRLYRQNPGAWDEESQYVQAISKVHGVMPADVVEALPLQDYPTLEAQISAQWLGGGPDGGAARALRHTAEFLRDQQKIPVVFDDYSPYVASGWAERLAEELTAEKN